MRRTPVDGTGCAPSWALLRSLRAVPPLLSKRILPRGLLPQSMAWSARAADRVRGSRRRRASAVVSPHVFRSRGAAPARPRVPFKGLLRARGRTSFDAVALLSLAPLDPGLPARAAGALDFRALLRSPVRAAGPPCGRSLPGIRCPPSGSSPHRAGALAPLRPRPSIGPRRLRGAARPSFRRSGPFEVSGVSPRAAHRHVRRGRFHQTVLLTAERVRNRATPVPPVRPWHGAMQRRGSPRTTRRSRASSGAAGAPIGRAFAASARACTRAHANAGGVALASHRVKGGHSHEDHRLAAHRLGHLARAG